MSLSVKNSHMKEKLLWLLAGLLLVTIIGPPIYLKWQYQRRIATLTSMDPNQVTTFRIYSRVNSPFGVPIEFKTPDPIVDDFFRSIVDIRSYLTTHDTVESRDHSWFLEISTGDSMIQMSFYIPSAVGDIVVGDIGRYRETSTVVYGDFKSKLLFQWYQKYSHRWLEAGSK